MIDLPETLYDLPIASISGKIKVEKRDTSSIQWQINFMSENMSYQASAFAGTTFDEVIECESNWGQNFTYTDYNNGGSIAYGVNECGGIQSFAQDSSYSAVTGAVVYIGKIIGK